MNYSISKSYVGHTIRRAKERYKLILTENQICEIADLILNGVGIWKKDSSRFRGIYKLHYMGKNLVVVFDRVELLPVTLLPHSALASMGQIRGDFYN